MDTVNNKNAPNTREADIEPAVINSPKLDARADLTRGAEFLTLSLSFRKCEGGLH